VRRLVTIYVGAAEYDAILAVNAHDQTRHPWYANYVAVCGPEDSKPSGIALPTASDKQNLRCYFINGFTIKTSIYKASYVETVAWPRVLEATLASWVVALCRASESFVPRAKGFLNTHPKRRCWNTQCHRPVGWEWWSLGCIACGFSACSSCGNCFSRYPGGTNVDTGEYIPQLAKHNSIAPPDRVPLIRAAMATYHVLHDRYPTHWRLLRALEPEWGDFEIE